MPMRDNIGDLLARPLPSQGNLTTRLFRVISLMQPIRRLKRRMKDHGPEITNFNKTLLIFWYLTKY